MKLVLAITGASGAIYPRLFIETIKKNPKIEIMVVATKNAIRIFREECGLSLSDYFPELKSATDFDVPYVSGSAKWDAMVVLPCSMGTLGRIAAGISDDAITRAADVCLKERRKLLLVPRETPLSLIHIENMLKVTTAGALVLPANPSYYGLPKNIEEVAQTVVARVLDHLQIENNLATRWHNEDS